MPSAAPPVAPARKWFVCNSQGQKYGPVDKVELDSWAIEGRLKGDDLVLRDDWPEWRPATDLYPALGRSFSGSQGEKGSILAADKRRHAFPQKPLGVVMIMIYTGVGAMANLAVAVSCSFFIGAIAAGVEWGTAIGGGLGILRRTDVAFLVLLYIALVALEMVIYFLAVFAAAVYYGLLTFQVWAYRITEIYYRISLTLGIVGAGFYLLCLASAGGRTVFNLLVLVHQLAAVLPAIIILNYLDKPRVRSWFKSIQG